MSKMKKVVLFLVEGITDQVALESVLPLLVENEEVTFQMAQGDITTKSGVDAHNVITEVYRPVKRYLENGHYRKSDIYEIVHLIDTDGAFAPADAVKYKAVGHIRYFPDCMETKDVEYIRERNRKKAESLSRLSTTQKIAGIPYAVYFFSSNLEHVLHGKQEDLTSARKMELAEEFSDLYEEDAEGFLEFINSGEFAVKGSYRESWDFMKQNCNSLKRFCNFHLFFHEIQN